MKFVIVIAAILFVIGWAIHKAFAPVRFILVQCGYMKVPFGMRLEAEEQLKFLEELHRHNPNINSRFPKRIEAQRSILNCLWGRGFKRTIE